MTTVLVLLAIAMTCTGVFAWIVVHVGARKEHEDAQEFLRHYYAQSSHRELQEPVSSPRDPADDSKRVRIQRGHHGFDQGVL